MSKKSSPGSFSDTVNIQHTDADLPNKASIITNIILEKKFGCSKGFTIGSM